MIGIGLIGCGNIGHIIAKYQDTFEIRALFDILPEKSHELAAISGGIAYDDFEAFIAADFDIVVEAASVRAARAFAPRILENNKDMVIMSVGALADKDFTAAITETARRNNRKIYVPSGAIMGLDNIKAARITGISHLLLRTTKSPESLGITSAERKIVFAGKSNECIKEFPKNVNVSVALGLAAGTDADVELWVDPAVDRNIHEIFIDGEFGDAYIRVRNVPSPDNPATSYLAALSILTLLRNLDNPLVVGT